MARAKTAYKSKATSKEADPFQPRDRDEAARLKEPDVHIYANGAVCDTDTRGYALPDNQSINEIVVDASEGFIPLWARDVTLRWRFQERSMAIFRNPSAAKAAIRRLFGEALVKWGDAAPVRFTEKRDAWDFEIVVREADRCNINGCVLASAFFPDSGRHELRIYPKMFTQSRQEQIETLIHEIGHIFGLRHFFAKIAETGAASEIFGEHKELSIMNYGADSQLTFALRSTLLRLASARMAARNVFSSRLRQTAARSFASVFLRSRISAPCGESMIDFITEISERSIASSMRSTNGPSLASAASAPSAELSRSAAPIAR
jgi:hypothetical protein